MAKEKGTRYKYDIFLSHKNADISAVHRIADKLHAVGLIPFVEVNESEAALENSRITAVFISPKNDNPWEEAGIQGVLNQQKNDLARRVIPVLLPGNYEPDIPAFLDQNTWVDFRKTNIEDHEIFSHLLTVIWGGTSPKAPRKAQKRAHIPERHPGDLHFTLGHSRYPDSYDKALTKRLGDHKLALYLAMHYIDVHELTIPAYIQRLGDIVKAPPLDVPQWNNNLRKAKGYDQNLHQVLSLSWKALENETARKVFKLAAWCAPNTPIPLILLVHALQKTNEPDDITILLEIVTKTQDVLEDERAAAMQKHLEEIPGAEDKYNQLRATLTSNTTGLAKSIKVLTHLGLLRQIQNPGPQLYPLVCEYGQLLDDEESSHMRSMADALVEQSAKTSYSYQPSVIAPLQPHLESLATLAESRLPIRASSLWINLGTYLKRIRGFPSAITSYQRALAILKSIQEPDDAKIAHTLNDLGAAHQDKGDSLAAIDYFQQAIEIHIAMYGEQHSEVAKSLNNIGVGLQHSGDLTGALEHHQQALAIRQQFFDDKGPAVSESLNNIGIVLIKMGNLSDAFEYLQKALVIDRIVYGHQNPNLGVCLNNIGLLLGHMGDLAPACAHLRQALAIFEATLPAWHPYIAEGEEVLAHFGCDEDERMPSPRLGL